MSLQHCPVKRRIILLQTPPLFSLEMIYPHVMIPLLKFLVLFYTVLELCRFDTRLAFLPSAFSAFSNLFASSAHSKDRRRPHTL